MDEIRGALGPGDRAPDFELPAADREGTIALAEHRRRGPVVLSLLRGLYCPFCRRQISQMRPMYNALKASGIAMIGVVVASPDHARQYFRRFPACLPLAAAPDRALHRAFGLPETARTPEFRVETDRQAADVLREMGVAARSEGPAMTYYTADGFEPTAEDETERERPLQSVGHFLIGEDGVIRWARVGWRERESLPAVSELLAAG
jgi:peroxiredoxin